MFIDCPPALHKAPHCSVQTMKRGTRQQEPCPHIAYALVEEIRNTHEKGVFVVGFEESNKT